jgi:glycine cleavage system H protein
MVILFVLVTIAGCLVVELVRQSRERREMANESGPLTGPDYLLPLIAYEEPPGGLFLHSGHTWAKLETSGGVRVGLDGFARNVLGRIDRFELPGEGTNLRQGEPAFAALQSGKRIEFVSPVDGIVCAVNRELTSNPQGSKRDPYGKGWALELRPSAISRNLEKLRIGADASAWLAREVRSFSEFLCLHRAAPVGVGVTLPDGGTHVEGIMERMDGETLRIAIRKYFR